MVDRANRWGLGLARFAGFAALGPITGPLMAGALRNWTRGDRVLASLYLLAALEMWVALPALLAALVKISAS